MTVRRVPTLLLPAIALTMWLGSAAGAVPPGPVVDDITDQARVLSSTEVSEVQSAIDDLRSETGLNLAVVYVSDFSGIDPLVWVDDSAIASGMGPEDILFAVAVNDANYGLSVDQELAISESQLREINNNYIEPKVVAGDWAGAAIAAAEGYTDAMTGGSTAAPAPTGGKTPWTLLLFLAAGVGLVAFLVSRNKARGAPSAGAPSAEPSGMSTKDLDSAASRALVELDDALRTSESELGFARAQFGLQATDAFAKAIADGKTKLGQAFALRQQLDDEVPEPEQKQRAMLTQIIDLATAVDADLDAQVAEFANLRQLQDRAGEVLDATAERATELRARLPVAETTLSGLKARYPGSALTTVVANVNQATALLDAVDEAIVSGRTALEAGDKGVAVAAARGAEESVAQAATLLTEVEKADTLLANAVASLGTALTSISADIADAERLGGTDSLIAASADRARAAVAAGRAAQSGGDPLAALHEIEAAEKALDESLAGVRATSETAAKTARQLDDLLPRVSAQIEAVSKYLETRKGTIGVDARTRLAEAARSLAEAVRLRSSDPAAALEHARRADQMVQLAQQAAEADVTRYSQANGVGPWDPRFQSGSPWGGSGGPGGVLWDVMLGGARRSPWGWGGGWSAGSDWSGGYSATGWGGGAPSRPTGGGSTSSRRTSFGGSSSSRRTSFGGGGTSRRSSSGRGGFGGGGRSGGGRSGGGRSGGGRRG